MPREFAAIFDSCGRHCSPNPTATEHWGLRSNLTGRPSGMRQGVCHGRLAAVSPFPAEIQVCTLEVPNSEGFSSRASARGKGQASSGTKQNFGTVPDPIPRDEVEVPSNYFYPGSLRRLGSTPASRRSRRMVTRSLDYWSQWPMLALGLIKLTTWILYDIASLEWTACHWEATESHLAVKTYTQHMSVCRPAAARGASIVFGHGTVATCPDKGSCSCPELFQSSQASSTTFPFTVATMLKPDEALWSAAPIPMSYKDPLLRWTPFHQLLPLQDTLICFRHDSKSPDGLITHTVASSTCSCLPSFVLLSSPTVALFRLTLPTVWFRVVPGSLDACLWLEDTPNVVQPHPLGIDLACVALSTASRFMKQVAA